MKLTNQLYVRFSNIHSDRLANRMFWMMASTKWAYRLLVAPVSTALV